MYPEDAYALGDELFVAPVETKGATSKTLIKPPGRWFSWWDGAELVGTEGASIEVPAPLTTLPLYLREGALVPLLRPGADTLSPSTDPGVDSYANEAGELWVRVQPGTGRFVMFDGTVLEQSQTQLTATPGTRFTTSVVWEFRGVTQPASVEHNGAPADVTFDGGVLLIRTPLDGQPTQLR